MVKQNKDMKKFEYISYAPKLTGLINKNIDIDHTAKILDEFGQLGWELISVTPLSGNTGFSWGAATAGVVMFFKREIL